MSFDALPVLDISLAQNPETKPAFLDDLRDALLDVGFLYIKNTGIDASLIHDVIEQGKAFFALPEDKKLEIQMKKQPSFLGYNLLGGETTAHRTDWREQIDLSTPHPLPDPKKDPPYHNLLAPNQWPDPTFLPAFRPTYESYISAMSALSRAFTSLIAESLSLPPTAFDRFFDTDQQHKLKIVKYPDVSSLSNGETQGVGPHKDSKLTSYLLQVPPHTGLQAQNLKGEWIDCPPKDGTFVVAIGQGLEALTRGVCKSTAHRVLSPAAGLGPRFSVPFFQGVSYDATFETVDVPARILKMRDERLAARGGGQGGDGVEFTFAKGKYKHLGEAALANRVKSHPDVGEAWYPDLLAEIRRDEAAEANAKADVKADGKSDDKAKRPPPPRDADAGKEQLVNGEKARIEVESREMLTAQGATA
ncbi:MAG: hypothetical protein OHK93_001534 [Ramalina farinacea]|uniref:Fe2OG dioxygenase domain-containing protein n=1 Tax=Ramalina farinacea TaxID=258253 RepID=A0AA43TWB8_9LECA|nr:hypothetical protein [Ramalina farinacea]